MKIQYQHESGPIEIEDAEFEGYVFFGINRKINLQPRDYTINKRYFKTLKVIK